MDNQVVQAMPYSQGHSIFS